MRPCLVPILVLAVVSASCGGATSSSTPTATGVTTTAETTTSTPIGYVWARVPLDEAAFGSDPLIGGVTAGGPGLVAVGVGDDRGSAWLSADGQTWSRVDDRALAEGSPLRVVAGGPGLVAVGWIYERSIGVWTSEDGTSWTLIEDDTFFDVNPFRLEVAANDDHVVMVAMTEVTGTPVWVSEDGFSWTKVDHDEAVFGDPYYNGLTDVAAVGAGFVIVGEGVDGTMVWLSEDGHIWRRIAAGNQISPGVGVDDQPDFGAVAAGGPGVVAVGQRSTVGEAPVWTSVDGTTWRTVPIVGDAFAGVDELAAITAGGPGLVAGMGGFWGGSSEMAIWVSRDGLTWTGVSLPGASAIYEIAVWNGGLVAIGDDTNSESAMWVSPPSG